MTELLIAALAVFGYGMVSKNVLPAVITPAMVFTSVGLILGGGVLGVFDPGLTVTSTEVIIEATLVLVLFSDAVRIDLRVLRTHAGPPLRLLGGALPLTVVAGTGVGMWLLDLPIWNAMLLAAILAPTDAALGSAVVTDQRLPATVRQTVNVESGLNDGIVLPLVTVLVGVVASEVDDESTSEVARFVAEQIGFGVAAGLIAGGLGGLVLARSVRSDHVSGVFRQLSTLAVPVVAYATAVLLGGNGFIAAFVGGIAFGRAIPGAVEHVVDFTEDYAELLTAATFLVFAAGTAGPLLDALDWRVALYVVASLTVVRIVPTLIALAGSGLLLETRLFLGWFGPRGLASILFMLTVVEDLSAAAAQPLLVAISWTVLVSVYAHGLSAAPWAARLSRKLAEHSAAEVAMAESTDVPELPTRRRPTSTVDA